MAVHSIVERCGYSSVRPVSRLWPSSSQPLISEDERKLGEEWAVAYASRGECGTAHRARFKGAFAEHFGGHATSQHTEGVAFYKRRGYFRERFARGRQPQKSVGASVPRMRAYSAPLVPLLLALCFVSNAHACKHGDKTYKDGDEWKEKDSFMMRCTIMTGGAWKTEVVACLTPAGQRIPINESAAVGEDEWSCVVQPNGIIALRHSPYKFAKCGTHEAGEKWRDKSFEFECLQGGQQKLLGCIADGGVVIPPNGEKEVNGYLMKCQHFPNGTVTMHGTWIPSSVKTQVIVECVDSNNVNHAVESWWVDNHRFNKTCLPTGRIDIVNCVTPAGDKVPVNHDLVKDGVKYTCEKTKEGGVRYASGPVEHM